MSVYLCQQERITKIFNTFLTDDTLFKIRACESICSKVWLLCRHIDTAVATSESYAGGKTKYFCLVLPTLCYPRYWLL